jgi:hypothetical protein
VPARDCPDGDCVVAAINRQFLASADRRLPDAERVEALKFLVHLVADVHQPLHASPVDDKGGQDFQVGWHGKGRNLHSVGTQLIFDRALQAQALDETGYLRQLQAQAPLPRTATPLRPAGGGLGAGKLPRGEGRRHLSAEARDRDDYLDAQRRGPSASCASLARASPTC